jgi:hypothetical protein
VSRSSGQASTSDIRAWARAQGLDVSEHGLPAYAHDEPAITGNVAPAGGVA